MLSNLIVLTKSAVRTICNQAVDPRVIIGKPVSFETFENLAK
jgi:hypothetical protein